MIVFPNCKINLGLHVVRKRDDGFHDIETVFYPLPLYDALEIISDEKGVLNKYSFSQSGLVTGNATENLCIKAYGLLQKDFPSIPSIRLHLHKAIPLGAGLGGGSSDAAFTLLLLNELASLKLSKEQLFSYALQLGSDVPFFLLNKPCFATGRGELMKEITLDLSQLTFIIVNPGIHLDTGLMFGKVKPGVASFSLDKLSSTPLEDWKQLARNDFEPVAIDMYPEIGEIKNKLYQQGAVYAAMSGSGSTVYGIFKNDIASALSFPRHYFIKKLVGQA